MVEDINKHIDSLVEKVVKESSLESPSLDFTSNIMSQIEAVSQNEITVYEPLISKRVWLAISILVIGILSYGILGNGLESFGWFDNIDYSIISNNKVTEVISGITFSKTLMYAVGLCGLLFFIQIPMMKHYFDKQLEY